MRLSKTFWSLLIFGVIIIAGGIIYMLWQQEKTSQSTLNEQLASAQASLPGLQKQETDAAAQSSQLQKDLTSAKTNLASVTASYPTSVESTEYGVLFFQLAGSNAITIVNFTAQEPTQDTVAGVSYTATYFEVTVTGTINDILSFVTQLEVDNNFLTGFMPSVDVSFSPQTADSAEPPQAIIDVKIMSYKG